MKKGNWTGRIMCGNSILKHVIDCKKEEGILVKRRRRSRRDFLLDDFKEKRRKCEFKEEELYRIF